MSNESHVMNRHLESVADFAAHSPFTEAQLRWWIFNRSQNGLSASHAVVRIGRRVYIDVDGFERWIAAQNTQEAA